MMKVEEKLWREESSENFYFFSSKTKKVAEPIRKEGMKMLLGQSKISPLPPSTSALPHAKDLYNTLCTKNHFRKEPHSKEKSPKQKKKGSLFFTPHLL